MKTDSRTLIDNLKISAPCPVGWKNLDGDELTRYCKQCKLNVYNISELSKQEATDLIRANEGESLCIKLYRRWDGKVATNDCIQGLRWTRRFVRLATILLITGVVFLGLMDDASAQGLVGAPVDPIGLRGSSSTYGQDRTASCMTEFYENHKILLEHGASFLIALVLYLKMKRKATLIALGIALITGFFTLGALTG